MNFFKSPFNLFIVLSLFINMTLVGCGQSKVDYTKKTEIIQSQPQPVQTSQEVAQNTPLPATEATPAPAASPASTTPVAQDTAAVTNSDDAIAVIPQSTDESTSKDEVIGDAINDLAPLKGAIQLPEPAPSNGQPSISNTETVQKDSDKLAIKTGPNPRSGLEIPKDPVQQVNDTVKDDSKPLEEKAIDLASNDDDLNFIDEKEKFRPVYGVVTGSYKPFLKVYRGAPLWLYWPKPLHKRNVLDMPSRLDNEEKEGLGYVVSKNNLADHYTVRSKISLTQKIQHRCIADKEFTDKNKTPLPSSTSLILHHLKSNQTTTLENIPQPFSFDNLVCVDLQKSFPSQINLAIVEDRDGNTMAILEGSNDKKYITTLGGTIEFKITQRLSGIEGGMGYGFDGAVKNALSDDFDLLHNSYVAEKRSISCGLERTLFIRLNLNPQGIASNAFVLIKTRQVDVSKMRSIEGQPIVLTPNFSKNDQQSLRACSSQHSAWDQCLNRTSTSTCTAEKHAKLISTAENNLLPLIQENLLKTEKFQEIIDWIELQ